LREAGNLGERSNDARRFNGAGAPEKQTRLPLLAGHLLCGGSLLLLLVNAVGFGLFLRYVLVYCFGGLVAHDV
jgi:hypothetical protein